MSKVKSFIEHSNSILLTDFVEEVRKADSEVDESSDHIPNGRWCRYSKYRQ